VRQFEHKASDLCWKGALFECRPEYCGGGGGGWGSQCTRSPELTEHFLPYPFQSFI